MNLLQYLRCILFTTFQLVLHTTNTLPTRYTKPRNITTSVIIPHRPNNFNPQDFNNYQFLAYIYITHLILTDIILIIINF